MISHKVFSFWEEDLSLMDRMPPTEDVAVGELGFEEDPIQNKDFALLHLSVPLL